MTNTKRGSFHCSGLFHLQKCFCQCYMVGVYRENIKPKPYLNKICSVGCTTVYLSSKKMTRKPYQPILYLTISYDLLATFSTSTNSIILSNLLHEYTITFCDRSDDYCAKEVVLVFHFLFFYLLE